MTIKKIIKPNKNRRNYEVIDTIIAGIILTGGEVKSIKSGNCNIDQSFVREEKRELFLESFKINPYFYSSELEKKKQDQLREKKLLLKKNEMIRIITKSKSLSCVIIPTNLLIVGRWIKVEIALAKSLKKFQKKRKEKDKERKFKKNLDSYE